MRVFGLAGKPAAEILFAVKFLLHAEIGVDFNVH